MMPTETPESTAAFTPPRRVGQRHTLGAEFRVENRRLDCGLGHAVTLDRLQQPSDVGGGHVIDGEEAGQQVITGDVFGRVHVLRRVQRLGHRDALAPAFGVGPDRSHDQGVFVGLDAERGAKRRHERKADPAQFDGR